VVAPDQIRTAIRTFRDRLPEICPGRSDVPKTLIYAKDDAHAEDIVQIVRVVSAGLAKAKRARVRGQARPAGSQRRAGEGAAGAD
jgi:type I site-specific restriction endonuclease